TYYAVGQSNGSDGTLYNQGGSGWAASTDDIQFEKDTTVEDANIFTLTLKMYEGDAFKILFDTTAGWSGTMINYYTLTEAAKTYFETNADSNIICKEGYDGVYTFTLTTDLSKTLEQYSERYVLSVTQDETIAPLPVPYKMQIKGGLNVDLVSKGSGVWSADFEVKKAHLYLDEEGNEVTTGGEYAAIYILNAGNVYTENVTFYDVAYKSAEGVMIGGNAYDVNLLDAGKYTVTFTEGEDGAGTVVIKKVTDQWHLVVNDVVDESDAGYDLTFGNGVWVSSTIILNEETKVQLKNLGNAEAGLVEVGTLPAGQWVISYNPETEDVVYAEWTWYIVGEYNGWAINATNNSIKLVNSEENIWTAEITISAAGEYKIATGNLIAGIDWDKAQYPVSGNFRFEAAGTYIVTLDTSSHEVSHTLKTDTTTPEVSE
ncbi:MAG: hypothetical protein K2N52_00690, partial [Clostridia bacterium]|nr:hypothetical protein [Clostridia bacterium]